MDITVEEMVLEGKETIPVLQVVDNGRGMNHEEIVKMLSFGHKRPEESDADQIGHFGVGFKVCNFINLHLICVSQATTRSFRI